MRKGKKFDVVVVGETGIDTNIYLQGNDVDFTVEANFIENLDYVGQSGGYSAGGGARLGKRTALIRWEPGGARSSCTEMENARISTMAKGG